ncbi:hypothetical protein [Spirochaeta dissipatitropha]
MKKLALVLVVLLAFGGLVFAEEFTGPTLEVTGDASLVWQIDLNDPNLNGFENSEGSSGSVKFSASTAKATEGTGWWGELAVSLSASAVGFENMIVVDEDGNPTFNDDGDLIKKQFLTGEFSTSVDTARLTNGVLYVDIKKPSIEIDMAKNFHGDPAANEAYDEVKGHGFTFGQFEQEALVKTFAIAVSSDEGKASNSYSYAAIATLDLAEIVDLDAGVYLKSVPQANTFGFGLKPTISVAPATIVLGFDGKLADEFTYDFLADIAVDLGDIALSLKAFNNSDEVLDVQAGLTATLIEVLKAGLTVDARELINDADVTLGVAAHLTYDGAFGEDTFIDVDAFKADAFAAAGLFGAGVKVSTDDVLGDAIDFKVNVGAGTAIDAITANVWSVLGISTAEGAELGWTAAAKLGYSEGGLGVTAAAAFTDAETSYFKVEAVAGAEFTSIENTTFTLGWGVAQYGPAGAADNGVLSLTTKIAF